MHNITSLTEIDEIVAGRNLKAHIKISASWCAPCKALVEPWDELNLEVMDAEFYNFVVDNVKDGVYFTAKHNIRSVPTLLTIKNGVMIHSVIKSPTDLRNKVLSL